MNASEIKAIREALGLTRVFVSRMLVVNYAQVCAWETGRLPIPERHLVIYARLNIITCYGGPSEGFVKAVALNDPLTALGYALVDGKNPDLWSVL